MFSSVERDACLLGCASRSLALEAHSACLLVWTLLNARLSCQRPCG